MKANPFLRPIVIVLSLLALSASTALSQNVFYQGVSIYDQTSAKVTINGFPLAKITTSRQPLITTDLNPYLIQGSNEISWQITGQPAPTLHLNCGFVCQK